MESIQVIFYLYGAYVINFEEFKSIETQKEFQIIDSIICEWW